MKAKLVPAVAELKSGDPKSEDVFVGPLISEKEAKRIEDWVQEAVSRGTHFNLHFTSHCKWCSFTYFPSSWTHPFCGKGTSGYFVLARMLSQDCSGF